MRYADGTAFRKALADRFRRQHPDQYVGRLQKRVAMERFLARVVARGSRTSSTWCSCAKLPSPTSRPCGGPLPRRSSGAEPTSFPHGSRCRCTRGPVSTGNTRRTCISTRAPTRSSAVRASWTPSWTRSGSTTDGDGDGRACGGCAAGDRPGGIGSRSRRAYRVASPPPPSPPRSSAPRARPQASGGRKHNEAHAAQRRFAQHARDGRALGGAEAGVAEGFLELDLGCTADVARHARRADLVGDAAAGRR